MDEERQVFWVEEDIVHRLKRVEGQIRGIQAMVVRRESCRAILTQIAAVEGALGRIQRIVAACSLVEEIGGVAELPDAEVVREHLKEWLDKA
jgi:DNA-binding FrmR family transcriptional regulator